MNTCTSIYIYMYICIPTCTRHYALAIASASFPPGSLGEPQGSRLGAKVLEPTMTVLDPHMQSLTRFPQSVMICYMFGRLKRVNKTKL